MILIDNTNDLLLIAGVEIKAEVFDNDMVSHKLVDRKSEIDNLYMMISECGFDRENDKTLMIEDQQYLISLMDEYIFSSVSTNEFVALSENKEQFLQICHSILKANGLSGDEADTLIRGADIPMVTDDEDDTLELEIVYEIKQFDIWASRELCSFGVFTDKEVAIKKMYKGLEHSYPGIGNELRRDNDQWRSDTHEFIIQIQEIELNKFGEL